MPVCASSARSVPVCVRGENHNGWEKRKYQSDVESTQQRSRFHLLLTGRSNVETCTRRSALASCPASPSPARCAPPTPLEPLWDRGTRTEFPTRCQVGLGPRAGAPGRYVLPLVALGRTPRCCHPATTCLRTPVCTMWM